MEVDHDGISRCAQRAGFEFAVKHGEGIVERRHEDAADGVDDQRAPAAPGVDQRRAAARRSRRKIRRANEPRRALDEHQRLALIPGMIAERYRVGAGVDEFLVDRLRDAEAAGRVLAVDDHEIEAEVADQAGQMFRDGGAPGPADHVTDEENAQLMNSGNRTPSFPLAQNPAARRAAVPEPSLPAAPRRQGRWPRNLSICAIAPACDRNAPRHNRCGGPPGRMPPGAPARYWARFRPRPATARECRAARVITCRGDSRREISAPDRAP